MVETAGGWMPKWCGGILYADDASGIFIRGVAETTERLNVVWNEVELTEVLCVEDQSRGGFRSMDGWRL